MKPTGYFAFKDLLEKLSLRLKVVPQIGAAYLHGSAVKGHLRATSDFDIALLLRSQDHLSWLDRMELSADLECVAGRPVDMGILSTGNLVYAKEVAVSGILLFTKNQLVSDRFIAQALAMYADLQENRQEVLQSYAA